MWKDFFFFSSKQRVGILLLLMILLFTVAARFLLPLFFASALRLEDAVLKDEIESFQAELIRLDSVQKKQYRETKALKDSLRLAHYDSVLAQSELIRLAKFDSVRNYWNNRRKAFSDSIQNLKRRREMTSSNNSTEKQNSLKIRVNSTDSTTLFQIVGVRKFILRSLWIYKEKLGGFYSPEQFAEVYYIKPEEIEVLTSILEINSSSIRKILVNKATVAQMKSHPYFNFYQAKAIYELRRKKGKLSALDELSVLTAFAENDFKKISPYLSFSD